MSSYLPKNDAANGSNQLKLNDMSLINQQNIIDPRLSKLNFLVIDDDPFEQKLISTVLGKLGAENVQCVGGGQAGLDTIKSSSQEVDITLCDLKMPDIDGLEFVRRLSEFSDSPAIIFASGADNSICRAAEQIGEQLGTRILGSVTKPVSPEMLLQSMVKFFDSGKKFKHLGATSDVLISEDQAKAGLKGGQIEMHYQPKVSVESGEIIGFESLARWRDKKLGILGPAAFIPTIERCGLMNRLTDVVVDKTLTDLAEWNSQFPALQVSINVAAENLSNLDLPNFVVSTANAHSINPNRITLEVTESGVASDATTAMEILTRLRLNDVRLSIDDFGTGYASLDKLKDLPFSELKIDRGFVQGAASNESAMALLEFACDLGKKLGLHIVAEGVETQTQWDLLAALGCHAIQGFFVSKPIPVDKVPEWIAQWNSQQQDIAMSF